MSSPVRAPCARSRLAVQVACLSVLLVLTTRLAASNFKVIFSGSLRTVDPALQNKFHVGDAFEFGISINTADLVGYDTSGNTSYKAYNPYFKIGNNYSGVSSVDWQYGVFRSGALQHGGTEQGFTFELNNMLAPPVNGFPLTDTYINVGFDRPLGNPVYGQTNLIGPAELLSINDRSVVLQNSSLSYDSSPNYKYLKIDINSVAVVPEPTCATMAIMTAVLWARRRPRRSLDAT